MDHFKVGTQLIQDGQYAEAIAHLDKAISIVGPRYELLDAQAGAYEKLEDRQGAMRCARRMIEGHAEKPKGYMRAARALAQRREWGRAVQMLELAVPLAASTKRDALLRQLEAYRRHVPLRPPAVDPMARLPTDVWSMIFAHGVEERPDFPVAAAQVSTLWRHTVLSLPAAWAHLRMAPKRGAMRIQRAKAKAWMGRSQGNLRSIALDLSNGPTATEAELEDLAGILLPAIGRVRKLFISCHHMSSITDAWAGQCRNLTDLAIAHLESTTLSSPVPTFACNMINSGSATLRRLDVRNGHILSNDLTQSQVASLRHLAVSGLCRRFAIRELAKRTVPYVSPVHELLSWTPELETCDFAYVLTGDSGPVLEATTSAAPCIHLPRLRSWAERATVPAFWPDSSVRRSSVRHSTLLGKVGIPAIDTISISHPDSRLVGAEGHLATAGVRVSHLRRVHFIGPVHADKNDFISLIKELRDVEELTLTSIYPDVSAAILQDLAENPRHHPQLRKLDIDCTGCTGSNLIKLIEGRLGNSISSKPLNGSPGLADGGISSVHAGATGLALSEVAPIDTLILQCADALHKSAEEWLREHVPDFRCIRPPANGRR